MVLFYFKEITFLGNKKSFVMNDQNTSSEDHPYKKRPPKSHQLQVVDAFGKIIHREKSREGGNQKSIAEGFGKAQALIEAIE